MGEPDLGGAGKKHEKIQNGGDKPDNIVGVTKGGTKGEPERGGTSGVGGSWK